MFGASCGGGAQGGIISGVLVSEGTSLRRKMEHDIVPSASMAQFPESVVLDPLLGLATECEASHPATSIAASRSSNVVARALRVVVISPAKALASGVKKLRHIPARCGSNENGEPDLEDYGYPRRSPPEVASSCCMLSGSVSMSSSERSSWWKRPAIMCDVPHSSGSSSSGRLSFELGYIPDSGQFVQKPERSSELPASGASSESAICIHISSSPGSSGSLEAPSSELSYCSAKSSVRTNSKRGNISKNQERSEDEQMSSESECLTSDEVSVAVVNLPEESDEHGSVPSSSEKGSTLGLAALYRQLLKASYIRSNNMGRKICRHWRNFLGDRTTRQKVNYGVLV